MNMYMHACMCAQFGTTWPGYSNVASSAPVPHSTMWVLMGRLGVPPHFITICRDMYAESFQSIKSGTGVTPLNRGNKQGCPLGPLLFNISLEGLLHVPKLSTFNGNQFRGGAKVSCLAYAEYLCPISLTKQETQEMVHTAYDYFSWAGLELNAEKCGSLTMINSRGRKYM